MKPIAFAELGLNDELLQAVSHARYQTPTPIQEQSIPILLKGHDLLGIAQTGTGKTAAFALPILQHMLRRKVSEGKCPRHVRVLILAPTRELAAQIGEQLGIFTRGLPLKHTVIFGGVGQDAQVKALKKGVEILVATPGRLLDLMNQGYISLKFVNYFVLDEADRMLDMGFAPDVQRVIAKLAVDDRQSLLFSATMPPQISELAHSLLREPRTVEVTPEVVTVERIEQHVFHLPTREKRALLLELFEDKSLNRVIVFTRTKHRANRVAEYLTKGGISAMAIHGNKSQNARTKALDTFRSGKTRVLVATDIAARGIDVPQVSHVINFELPNEPESYVHRIGRTARAGRDGIAYSFCDPEEYSYLQDIEKLTRRPLEVRFGQPPQVVPKPPARGGSGRRAPQKPAASTSGQGRKKEGEGSANCRPRRRNHRPRNSQPSA